jgi:hypothetical protein
MGEMSERSGSRFRFHLACACLSAVSAIVFGLAAGSDLSLAAVGRVEPGRVIRIGTPVTSITRIPSELMPKAVAPAAKTGGTAAASSVLKEVRSKAGSLSQRQVFAVVDGEAKRLDEKAAATLAPRIALTAEILPNAAVAAMPATAAIAARFPEARDAFVWPTRYTAAVANEARAVPFNVALSVLANFSYDPAARGYFARLIAYLVNPDSPTDTSELAQEVPVSIAAEGAANLMPLRFRQLNTPQEVRLDVSSPSDPYLVRAITALDQDGAPISIGISRPAIRVSAVSNPIRGFGLETTQVNIDVDKAGPIDNDTVSLVVSQGTIAPGSVTLKAGSASAVLTSSGLGSSTVTATRSGFDSGTQTVEFAFPTIFLIAVSAGGLIGAVAALLAGAGGRSWPRTIFVGLVAAVAVVVGQVVGIQIGDLSAPTGVTGDALFFVLALVAGFLGEAVFNRGAGQAG